MTRVLLLAAALACLGAADAGEMRLPVDGRVWPRRSLDVARGDVEAGCSVVQAGTGYVDAARMRPRNGQTTTVRCGKLPAWKHQGVGFGVLFAADGKVFLALGHRCAGRCAELDSVDTHLLLGTVGERAVTVKDLGVMPVGSALGRLAEGGIVLLTPDDGFVLRADGQRCPFRLDRPGRVEDAAVLLAQGDPRCAGFDVAAMRDLVVLPSGL
jgi:hypothetical protein